jgi:hypothetical protein
MEFPQQWKESIIVQIHKKCGKSECNNYQGRKVLIVQTTTVL